MHNAGSADEQFYSFMTVQCRHLGLLTWGCWVFSDFPGGKSESKGNSRFQL